mgnify:CR=1 FL=1
MAAIPISGQNGETIVGQTTDVRHILETPGETGPDFDGNGRVFELLNLSITNSHATATLTLRLCDSDESTAIVTTTQVGPEIRVAAGDTQKIEWARNTGPRFRTNITASIATNTGTVALNSVQASGLLY